MSVLNSGVPFETDKSALLVRAAQKASGGKILGVNFGTDARYYVPKQAIVLGPGRPDIAHQRDEHINVADLGKAVEYYRSIAKSCLGDDI